MASEHETESDYWQTIADYARKQRRAKAIKVLQVLFFVIAAGAVLFLVWP